VAPIPGLPQKISYEETKLNTLHHLKDGRGSGKNGSTILGTDQSSTSRSPGLVSLEHPLLPQTEE